MNVTSLGTRVIASNAACCTMMKVWVVVAPVATSVTV